MNVNRRQAMGQIVEILRMATSIKQGTATASLMLRKLGSYPRQNGLAVAVPCLIEVAIRRISSQWARTCLMLSVPPIIGFNAS